ncbi:MAG TPA: class I SAM-dependent methyltransferase [Dehalococcoidia bacterium]|nr:class I SAM-dependent methyltransferase [Dehalococcoidia bacterium]
MFDWARGSVLKKMIEVGIPQAFHDPWLKGWAAAWPLALLKIPSGARVLDIGSGNHPYYARRFASMGCEAHVLEEPSVAGAAHPGWGVREETVRANPDIVFHLGLAGQDVPPASAFDLITCISVLEHVYDSRKVVDPDDPMPHLNFLRDMVRMLAPGGVMVLTVDFFLNDMPHWRGWDYLLDVEFLMACGMGLLSPSSKIYSRTFLYNHEDTLFMAPEGILSFADRYYRSTSVGMMFRKPGSAERVTLSPHPSLAPLLNLGGIQLGPSEGESLEHDGRAQIGGLEMIAEVSGRDLCRVLMQRIWGRLRR